MATFSGTTGNDSLMGSTGNDLMYGLAGDDSVVGNKGDDTLYGGGGHDHLNGWGGNDTIVHHGTGGVLSGGAGDDYIEAQKTGYGQFHIYAGDGNDRIVMSLTNNTFWGTETHHVYGGDGADRFEFNGTANANLTTMSRIDDFDASRDTIWVNGSQINLSALTGGNRIVEYWGQQFLLIGDKIVIGLEGARLFDENTNLPHHGAEEAHFWARDEFPQDIFTQPTVAFIDQVNYVPWSSYSAVYSSLNQVTGSGVVAGTSASDYIRTWDADLTNDSIIAGLGNDIIDSGQGRDTVHGNDGNDKIAGGIDRDMLYGDNGNDQIWGGGQNDSLYGGAGNDNESGGTGNDSIYGADGLDTLNGNNGNDRIWGEAGNDAMIGGGGNDTMRGGAGRDLATGNSGSDVFLFQTGDMTDWDNLTGTEAQKNLQFDRITDFVIGQDKINFTGVTGATNMSDFTIWRITEGTNVLFFVGIEATHERILVDVADSVTWSQFAVSSNFIFG